MSSHKFGVTVKFRVRLQAKLQFRMGSLVKAFSVLVARVLPWIK